MFHGKLWFFPETSFSRFPVAPGRFSRPSSASLRSALSQIHELQNYGRGLTMLWYYPASIGSKFVSAPNSKSWFVTLNGTMSKEPPVRGDPAVFEIHMEDLPNWRSVLKTQCCEKVLVEVHRTGPSVVLFPSGVPSTLLFFQPFRSCEDSCLDRSSVMDSFPAPRISGLNLPSGRMVF